MNDNLDLSFGWGNNATFNKSTKMVIKNTGNVGIGTTSPTHLLTVGEGISETGGTTSMAILAPGENADAILYFGTNNATTWVPKTAIISEGNNFWGQSKLHFCLNNTDDTTTAASLLNSRMTILPNGDVGINTTSPGAKLEVFHKFSTATHTTLPIDSDNISSNETVGLFLSKQPYNNTSYRYGLAMGTLTNGYSYIQSMSNTSNGRVLLINPTGTGNVGIGTSSPGSTLHIKAKSDSLYHNNGTNLILVLL